MPAVNISDIEFLQELNKIIRVNIETRLDALKREIMRLERSLQQAQSRRTILKNQIDRHNSLVRQAKELYKRCLSSRARSQNQVDCSKFKIQLSQAQNKLNRAIINLQEFDRMNTIAQQKLTDIKSVYQYKTRQINLLNKRSNFILKELYKHLSKYKKEELRLENNQLKSIFSTE